MMETTQSGQTPWNLGMTDLLSAQFAARELTRHLPGYPMLRRWRSTVYMDMERRPRYVHRACIDFSVTSVAHQRSYWYASGPYEHDEDSSNADAAYGTCSDESDCASFRPPLDLPLSRRNWIDKDYTDENAVPKVRSLHIYRTMQL